MLSDFLDLEDVKQFEKLIKNLNGDTSWELRQFISDKFKELNDDAYDKGFDEGFKSGHDKGFDKGCHSSANWGDW